ncbi:bacterioferritin-associated ferredoxin [Marinibaculum pumilum]|uniref:Bacterioferritin-associated ferredoxin n=1 Tax=Marinibaculum pumilum TaxID=1766165 RepID=A0ABV7KY22_9PROT
MIVCLCNGHNDRDIRAKAEEIGSTCPVTVYSALQGPPRCGRCLDYAGQMLCPMDRERSAEAAASDSRTAVASVQPMPVADARRAALA